MLWDYILKTLSFTGVKDITVWQDVIISSILVSSILLPLSLLVFQKAGEFWFYTRPLNQLLDGYIKNKTSVLAFLSQLTALDDQGQIDNNPQYIIKYLQPTPTNRTAITSTPRMNIDPVWSEGDGECLADIFNILGKVDKVENIYVASLIHDWCKWSSPIFSIGFNPKTHNLELRCEPIYYELTGNATLKIMGHNIELNCIRPNDAAIIQKTFIKNTNMPVFILAGHGFTGTSSAGYILREYCRELGKMYGSKPFCLLIYVNINEGRSSAIIRAAYPKPSFWRKIGYLPTYLKLRQNNIFPK